MPRELHRQWRVGLVSSSASIQELAGRLLDSIRQYGEANEEERARLIERWEQDGFAKEREHNPADREGVFRFVIDRVGADSSEAGFKYSDKNDNHAGLATPDRIIDLLKGKPGRARVRPGTNNKKDPAYLVLVDEGVVNSATLAKLTGKPESATAAEQVPPHVALRPWVSRFPRPRPG